MARSQSNKRLPSVEPPGGDDEEPDKDLQQDPLELFDHVLAQLGESDAQGFVRIYRMGAQANIADWEYLARVPISTWNLDAVAQTYKGGRYRLDLCDRAGRIIKQVKFHIAGPAAVSAPDPFQPQSHQAPTTPTPHDGRRDLLETMLIKSMETQGTILAALVSNLAGGNGVKVSDLVAVFKEGREASSVQALPHQAAIDLVKTGIELAQDGAGGASDAGGGDPFSGMASRALGVIEALLRQRSITPAPPAPSGNPSVIHARPAPARAELLPATATASSGAAPGPPSGVSPSAAQPAAQPLEASLMSLARAFVPKILKEATRGHDGYTWGCYIAERVPATWKQHLTMLANAESAARIEMLAGVDPRLREHRDFIDDAAEGIRAVFLGPDDAGPYDDDEGEGDDDSHHAPAAEPAGGGAGDNGDGGDHAPAGHPGGAASHREDVGRAH